MKYEIREITPEDMKCLAVSCPSIYELTPKNMRCAVGPCLAIYKEEGNYLIIGEQVDPKEVGLEKKVGEGEVLIKISKELIDEKEN